MSSRDRGLAHLPAQMANNPYGRLLYSALAEQGVDVVGGARLELGWLRRARPRVRFLHFHWDEHFYESRTPAGKTRPVRPWLELCQFAARLAAARALGYRIVWTIHEIVPRETRSRRRDVLAGRILGRLSSVLIAHDAATAERASSELGLAAGSVHVVPHGSYAGAYPQRRGRDQTRSELGAGDGDVVLLAFGHIRRYKQLELLLEAFAALEEPRAVLVVAGEVAWRVRDPAWEAGILASLHAAAERDPRIRLRLGFVPDEEVGDLYAACDAAVLARADGWTSGSLVLALSQGRPVVAARLPAYVELVGEAGWLYEPGDAGALRDALAAACAGDAASRGREARRRADALGWNAIAARVASLLLGGDPAAPIRVVSRGPTATAGPRVELGRGTNVSHWLSQTRWISEDERRRSFSRTDALRLRDLGLDHVRIPVDEENLWHADGNRLERAFDQLRRGLEWCRDADLAAVVDLHELRPGTGLDALPDLWRDLSRALGDLPPDAVAYELLNEPVAATDALWNETARACIDAIRFREPARTILVGSNRWSTPATFPALAVPDDPGLVLTFHYYEPTLVTHHRASWLEPFAAYAGPVDYPGRPIRALAGLDPKLRAALEPLNGHVDRARIDADLAAPLAVAARTGLPLHCGELGAIATLPDDVRLRWLRDVLDALDEAGISWTIWDLRGKFGLFEGDRPTVVHRAVAERARDAHAVA